jgi:hypothetical protein
VGGLLGCFGSLLSAQVGFGEGGPEGGAQRCTLSVRNNEVTRVRADLESAIVQSCISPGGAIRCAGSGRAKWLGELALGRLYVLQSITNPNPNSAPARRLLHAVAMAVAYRFAACDARQLRNLDTLLAQLLEYTSKDVLDLVVAVGLRAEAKGDKLRVSISGDTGAGAGAGPGGLSWQEVLPVYCVNDLNILTLLDTFRLFMEY